VEVVSGHNPERRDLEQKITSKEKKQVRVGRRGGVGGGGGAREIPNGPLGCWPNLSAVLVAGGRGLARVQRPQKAASNDAGFCDHFTQMYRYSAFPEVLVADKLNDCSLTTRRKETSADDKANRI
jgi:hypothetical protein